MSEDSASSGKRKLFTYTGWESIGILWSLPGWPGMLLVGLAVSQAAAGHLSVAQHLGKAFPALTPLGTQVLTV